MGHIREKYPELERRGARVVTILAERRERIREFLLSHTYPFPLLSDAGRQVVKEYGVYVRINFESVHISRPAVFILDGKGIIRYIFIASIQFEYARDDDIFSTLDAMHDT